MKRKRIKILFVITGLTRSGAEKQLYNLITNLSSEFEVVVLTFVKGKYYYLLKENYKVYFYPASPLTFASTVGYILRIIKDETPDIVNSWLVHANGMEATHMLHEIIERVLDFNSDGIITNSSFMKERLVKKFKYKEKKIDVIYNGFQFQNPKHKDVRKELELKKDTSIVTTIANFRYGKDYYAVVKVAKELSKKRDDVVFLFVGEGKKRKRIEKMVENLQLENKVFFLGRRDDVPEILSNSDVMFLPTLYESQSNTIIEAMFYKCPIVTTDIPGNREILKDGSDSFLVEVKDYHKMAKRIITLLDNEDIKKKFKEQAFSSAKELFDIDKMVKEYEGIYENFAYQKNKRKVLFDKR